MNKYEARYDLNLGIRSIGIREWKDETDYNRCEPTPYHALDHLFEYYSLNENDKFVDFGCGRGRVAFYTHNKFNVDVTGVEASDPTFDELLINQKGYQYKNKNTDANLYFEYGYAENYDIKDDDNVFYFFNPFSLTILKKVIRNIKLSYKRVPRKIDIVLYYPIPAYVRYLSHTKFKMINKIDVPNKTDKYQKFRIYRLEETNE